MQSLRSGGFRTAVLCVAVYLGAMAAAPAGQLGANKFDLMLQYTQAAPAGTDNPAAYVQIHRAMGKKAIVDAQAAGLPFFRVSITGYSPSSFTEKGNDLAGWQTNPAAFWAAMDAMFNDLDAAKIQLVSSFIWNPTQFAALTGESVGVFVKNPQSKSRLLLNQFIKDFITRYKSRKTILFYELTNEMNLQADQDMQRRSCPANTLASCVWSNFTTADMTRFGYDEVAVIKTLDPSRKITSGYAIPGSNALHMMRHPEFAPGGADLTADSPADLDQYLRYIHTPFDIISVHIYPSRDNNRFGRPAGNQHLLIADAAASASAVGKPLFVGEFGDSAGATNFIVRVLTEIVKQRVEYSAVWVWEFYQFSLSQTHDSNADIYSVEPGYSYTMLNLLTKTEQTIDPAAPTAVGALSNPPQVLITAPLVCARFTAPFDVWAVASDGAAAVQSLNFLVNGKTLATVLTPPYRFKLDPAAFGNQVVDIQAVATAKSGKVSTFTTKVILNRGLASACPTS